MLKNFILTFLVAMAPVVELRGAIPIGMGLGLTLLQAFILSFIGNLVPVPFIILFVRKLFAWLREKWPRLNRFVSRLENKALSQEELIKKYEAWGLFIFVAIPLPGTGAWTGALIAAMFNMRLKKAFPAIALGVLVAGIIISGVSYGLFNIF